MAVDVLWITYGTSGERQNDALRDLKLGNSEVIFELPVVILPGVSREFKHRVTAWLVRELGTEVNLANLEWDEIWIAEMTRRGAGGDTSHPGGAYRLTDLGES